MAGAPSRGLSRRSDQCRIKRIRLNGLHGYRCRDLVLVALAKLARHHLVAPLALFFRVVDELGFHHIAIERAFLVERGRRGQAEGVRAVVAVLASIAARDPQRLAQCVVGHWHAIVIGRPVDRGSAARDQRVRGRSGAERTESTPEVVQH
jgi:hypothetical protein